MTGDSDFELVSKALQGNQKAFRKIIEGHRSVVFAVVRAILGDRDDVEDVVQNVFIKIYRGLHGFRGRSKLSTWIYQIARNEALNAVAKRKPDFEPLEGFELAGPEASGPEAQYREQQLRERLGAALSFLDEAQRMAVELRYLGELSYNEIADMMDIPVGTVKTHIHRGKIELKRIIVKRMSSGERKEKKSR